MDLQNVARITIPEGEVNAIHDSSGHQVWGKLSYSTLYEGDSYQLINSGKNLLNPSPYFTGNGGYNQSAGTTFNNTYTSDVTVSTNKNVTIISNTSGFKGALFVSLPLTEGSDYVLSGSVSATNHRASMYILDATFTITRRIFNNTSSTVTYNKQVTIDTGEKYIAIFECSSTTGEKVTCTDFQVELGSSKSSWEEYDGGIVMPSPSNPQSITPVTGLQNIVLSDGIISNSYTVDLGSIELYKVDEKQDYIYKNGVNWYVHKEIGKYTFTGDETWYTDGYGTNSWRRDHLFSVNDYAQDKIVLLSDVGRSVAFNKRANYDNPPVSVCYYQNTNERFWIRNTTLTASDQVQAATIGKHVYYWATPTDTQITDSTLISQLEAVHQFLTRYGYNATVSGNLPIIIDKTNL